ncbi:MAG: amidohydrolase family protein [Pseudomonadota bacterium]
MSRKPASTAQLEIIDFHAHALPPGLATPPLQDAPLLPELRQIIARMADAEGLRRALDEQGVDRRIISVPLEAVPAQPGETASDHMRRINDALAELCETDPRLYGMAMINAYAGDAGASELERAVGDLGAVGCFVESARGNQLISNAACRPTLEAASSLGLPVFVHPVQEPSLDRKFEVASFYQMNLGRAAVASTALASLLESGVFDQLPNLNICVSSFALAALALGGLFDMTRPDARALLQRHIHVDTVGLNAPALRFTADILGADRLILGTDWPVFAGDSLRDRFIAAADEADFSSEERRLIASGNARRLFRLAP